MPQTQNLFLNQEFLAANANTFYPFAVPPDASVSSGFLAWASAVVDLSLKIEDGDETAVLSSVSQGASSVTLTFASGLSVVMPQAETFDGFTAYRLGYDFATLLSAGPGVVKVVEANCLMLSSSLAGIGLGTWAVPTGTRITASCLSFQPRRVLRIRHSETDPVTLVTTLTP